MSTCNQLSTADPTTAPATRPPSVITVAFPAMREKFIVKYVLLRIRLVSTCEILKLGLQLKLFLKMLLEVNYRTNNGVIIRRAPIMKLSYDQEI